MTKMIVRSQNELDDINDCSFSSNEYNDDDQDWIPQQYCKEFRPLGTDSISTFDSIDSTYKVSDTYAATAAHAKLEPDFWIGQV